MAALSSAPEARRHQVALRSPLASSPLLLQFSAALAPGCVFLTNDFAVPATTTVDFYRYRWQVELFFKWIKQHLRIKIFFGTSENAVKTQIWIAVSV
jgi:IS4 transposase